MGSISLICPMCCGESFNNPESLKYHLLSMTENLFCPGCSSKVDSVADLIQHLDICRIEKNSQMEDQELQQEDESNFSEHNGFEDCQFDSNSENIIVHDQDDNVESSETLFGTVNEDGIMMVGGKIIEVDENGDIRMVDKVIKKNIKNHNNKKKTKDVQNFQSNNESQVTNLAEFSSSDSNSYLFNEPVENETDAENKVIENNEMQDTSLLNVKKEYVDQMSMDLGPQKVFICDTCDMKFNDPVDHMDRYHDGQKYQEIDPNQEMDSNKTEEIIVPTLEPLISFKNEMETSIATSRPSRAAKRKFLQKQALNTMRTEECIDSEGRKYTRKVVKIERFWDKTPITLSTTKAPMIEKFFSNVEGVKVKDKSVTVAATKMYRCNQCLEQFPKLNDFRVHECPLGKDQCEHCDKTFATTKALENHMKTHDITEFRLPGQEVFVCDICSTEFATQKSLRLHARMHMPVKSRHVDAPEGTDEDTFDCDECGATLSESYRTAHMALHDGNTATCTICNRKFDSAESLKMHAAVHVETASANAAATTISATDLFNAATQNCIDPILANAGITGPLVSGASVAAAIEAAAAAEEAEISKEKPYMCQHCGRRFSRPHEKVKHERIHTGEKPHVCEVCGKRFRVSYCLTLHMRTHTGVRPYECHHCGKRFKASSVYNHHLLTHGDERAYTCPFCPKTFKTRVQLAGHKNSHTKPFRCTMCSRPFASLYAARSHMETHKKDNNLKFSCNICGASYGRAFAVKDHMKQAHGEEFLDENPPEAEHEEEVQDVVDESNYLLTNDENAVETDPTDDAMDPISSHNIQIDFISEN